MAIAKQTLPSGSEGVGKIALRSILGAGGLALLCYVPIGKAKAQAPIIFASPLTSDDAPAPSYQKVASAPPRAAAPPSSGAHLEYRYPDRPDMVFSAHGARQLENGSAPMAFSSSDAAIDVDAARRVSGTTAQPALQYASLTAKTPKTHQAGLPLARQKVGAPYQVMGRWYVPAEEPDYDEVGVGSWYGPQFHGKKTATGEVFDMHEMTAAHTTLPIPSLARVTNLENGRTIVVRINDRGPFVDNRIIDLSKKAAEVIGYQGAGKAKVRVEYIGPAPAEHNSLPAEYVAMNQRAAQSTSVSAPTPRPETAPMKPPAGYGDYLLQAGSFSELGNAHALRAKLQGLAPVYVAEARVGNRDYFRVMLGPWPSKPAAEEQRKRMRRMGVDTIVVAAK